MKRYVYLLYGVVFVLAMSAGLAFKYYARTNTDGAVPVDEGRSTIPKPQLKQSMTPGAKTMAPQTDVSGLPHRKQFEAALHPLNVFKLSKILREWALTDPAAALGAWESSAIPWVLGRESPREAALAALLEGWAEHDAQSAALWLNQRQDVQCPLTKAFVDAVGKVNPQLAMDLAYKNFSGVAGMNAVAQSILIAYGADPRLASENAIKMLKDTKDDWLAYVIMSNLWDSQGPEASVSFASKLLMDLPSGGLVTTTVARYAVGKDPISGLGKFFKSTNPGQNELMLDQIRESKGGAHFGRYPLGGALHTWRELLKTNPESGFEYLAKMEEGEMKVYLESKIPQTLSSIDPEKALKAFARISGGAVPDAARYLALEMQSKVGLLESRKFAERITDPVAKDAYLSALTVNKGKK